MRNAGGMRLEDLARRSGLAASTLSKIENRGMSPTFDTLVQIATGLGIDVSDLVSLDTSGAANGRRTITKAGAGMVHETSVYEYQFLGAEIAHKKFIPIIAKIRARSLKEFGAPIHHDGEEFFYVLEGEVALHTAHYAPALLQVGDSAYFDSRMDHAVVAAGDVDARILWVFSSMRESAAGD